MKLQHLLLALLLTVLASGCTTTKPIEVSPKSLQNKIATEKLFKKDDLVIITTKDGKQHDFRVTEIDANHISGKNITIPIKHIIAAEKKELSAGKSLAAVGGGAAFIYLLSVALVSSLFAL